MIAEVLLFDDRPSTVAVRATNLTLRNFPFQLGDRPFPSRELDHAGAFLADVIEVQDDGIALTAIDARRVPEIVEEEEEVAPAQRTRTQRSSPLRVNTQRPCTFGRAPPMTVRTHKLAIRDLVLDAIQAVRLTHQLAYLHPFRTDVIEFEDRRIHDAAVGALTGA
jgi:hypothetical protein